MRLRIKEKRRDPQYFDEVRRQLDTLSGIDEVRINSNTGTILLLHRQQSYFQLEAQLRQLNLFDIIDGPEPVPSALAPVSEGISMIDKAIAGGTGGSVDLRALAYIALVGFTVRQIMRGQVLGPALPMLWQAMSLVDRFSGWKKDTSPDAAHEGELPVDMEDDA